MNGLAQDVTSALRQLRRSPGLAAIIIATVGIGVGANTAIFSVVRGVLLRPLPYRDPERLVHVFSLWRAFGRGSVSLREFRDYSRDVKKVSGLAAWSLHEGNLAGAGAPEHVRILRASSSLMPVLGLSPALGRWYAPDEEGEGRPRIALLGDALWKRRFGADPGVVGRSVLLDGTPLQIIGVLPPAASFAPSGASVARAPVDLLLPLDFPATQESELARSNYNLHVVGRLAAGATMAELQAELSVVSAQANLDHPVNYPKEAGFTVAAIPLHDEMVGGVRDNLWMLFAAVALVLLIACANVANLLLAKASARERELAVRAALGASRSRLVRQMLIESVVLALAGGAAGAVLASWIVDALLGLAGASLPPVADVQIDVAVLAFAFGIAVLTGLIFGLVPAFSAAHVDFHESLGGAGRAASAPRPRRLRRALVVGEVALALVLLAAGGVLLRSFSRVVAVSPGFRPEGVVAMRVVLPPSPIRNPTPTQQAADDARVRGFWTAALQRLRALPGVDAAGAIQILPLSGIGTDQTFEVEGRVTPLGATPPDEEVRAVTSGFFEALGIPLLRGRYPKDSDTARAPGVVVVNASFAQKYWPGQDALGKRIRINFGALGQPGEGSWMAVTGVVGDVHEFGLDADVKPILYFPEEQTGGATPALNLVVHGQGDEESLAAAARSALREVDASLPVFDVRPMRDMLDGSLAQRRFALVLLESFAALALLLAALGLYGVVAYSVAQRTHEIGVRMALGAQRADVLGLVARESATLVGVGIALGGAGAFAATRLLTGLLYRTSPADPLAFAGGALLLMAVAAVATSLPARRAMRVTPLVALRTD